MQKSRGEGTSEHLLATLKAEREELNSSLSKEKLQTLHLKQELTDAETRNTDLYKVITWHTGLAIFRALLSNLVPELHAIWNLSCVCFPLINFSVAQKMFFLSISNAP